jgi:predicted AlkP superfamily pyrophosphatase or phosphodiesterase
MKKQFATLILILAAGISPAAFGQTSARRPTIVLSIDGLRPDYILDADKYGLKIPTLRHLMQQGVHASGVRGVLPTVTYPSHTTILTGVWPVKHGIHSNTTFDPYAKNKGGWYWYSEDIRVPTLWEAADRAGYTVGSVSWPVSVSARGVRYLIPEYWRAMTPDDIKLLRALSTPGLMADLAKTAGSYTTDLDDAVPGDWDRTKYAVAMIREKRVNFLTFHFAAFDHLEHAAGPFSPVALATLEEIDKMVAALVEAIRSASPNSVVCIVSDHGFAKVDHIFNLNQAFVKAGLITLKTQKNSLEASGITDWKAEPWSDGGSAAIVLKDPKDTSVEAKVKQLLDGLAADPANGIAKILNRSDIAALGGGQEATFWVDMRPGYAIGGALNGPEVQAVSVRGTHGYSPVHPELRAFFLIAGTGIREGADVGDIDMRSIAPTLAKVLNVPLPSAELKPLAVSSGK